ncbi:MAG: hypothetical protein JEY99_14280 [Spirochaetales bacterium]|nr:hypothetical protein [Spirochaetales bacterium]
MNKLRMKKLDKKSWLAVKPEPLHIQEFEKSYIRAYHAILTAGEETQFHKHSEDTLYIVLKGGAVATVLMKKNLSCPVIHKASASKRNKGVLELFGIEILEKKGSGNDIYLPGTCYRLEMKAEIFNVYSLILSPGQSTPHPFGNFPGLIILIQGSAAITVNNRQTVLSKGEHGWFNTQNHGEIRNNGRKTVNALIVGLKSLEG